METKYVLYGASGHAKVVFEIADAISQNIAAIIDDKPSSFHDFFQQKIVDAKLFNSENCKFLISIGNNQVRQVLSHKINQQFFTLIHPSTTISNSSKIGDGTVIMAGVIVNASVEIGNHCIINTAAVIEHDCTINDYVHICPNATLAGNVTIGEGSQIGVGAKVIQGVKIGKWSIIGAGAVVTQDIPDNCTAVGIPAKPIKFHK
jgi:sugar O-acyltransferase (sialic acid O-acetyltransferase NeuD family)